MHNTQNDSINCTLEAFVFDTSGPQKRTPTLWYF